ncbi:DUF2793 domain-containing protein [Aestuariivita sp.]|jgi:hypothetical protein|uniref:DUF2793 domain-containing protein n=1 Tax=Aestuariivita sp. TaxID=1872407 RepID=UPI002172B88F|nr:DUF2793 domain-containing protein [Aestuariivita sp.]MCE8009865.1 DUF2793 domain-containing protein [Aestuariivita sp.]
MTELSPRLGLPYIQPSQAQKHVTHNEAVRVLDTLVQMRILAFGVTTPPGGAVPGACYAIGVGAVLDWAGQDGMLAIADDTGWQFLAPSEGWIAWDETDRQIRVYSGGIWIAQAGGGAVAEEVPRIGVSTAPDAVNRLAIASDASLFTHAGAGHQMKLNKATAGDTASLLFQSDWTGHAEMGLAGDTAFSIKVSADGGTWVEAMRADPVAQNVTWAPDGTPRMALDGAALQLDVPLTGTAVQAQATDTTAGRLMLAQHGYGPGNLLGTVSQSGGVPTGAVIERGSNANGDYVRFADGTQICTHVPVSSLTANVASGSLFRSDEYAWSYPASFVSSDVALSVSVRTSSPIWGNSRTTGATTARVRLFSSVSAGAVTFDLLAVGRWL